MFSLVLPFFQETCALSCLNQERTELEIIVSFFLQYVAILRELELKMKAEILEKMKRKGTAAPNLTESDIDLDINYTSDIESR